MSALRLTPYLCVEDARTALTWYAEALGAQVRSPGWRTTVGSVTRS